ncbi:MAG TPA: hypothetical protein VE991_01145, partial [Acidimicrobiales bacterium]|nr:hypothetical protein [Acidimicrobiales bacterium]
MAHGPSARSLLVRGGRVPDWAATTGAEGLRLDPGPRLDLRIRAGTIEAAAPTLDLAPHEDVLDVGGCLVLPGLHDHHLHLRALVAAGRSVAVGPGDVAGRAGLARALAAAPVDRRGWRRAIGYHESVAGDLDRRVLDDLAPGGPVRLQHRSGAMWVVNSAGVTALGL